MRGVANILIQMLIVLIFIPIIYIVGGFIVSNFISAINTTNLTPQAGQTVNSLLQVWDYWPVIAVIVVILWAIAASQRREPWYEE